MRRIPLARVSSVALVALLIAFNWFVVPARAVPTLQEDATLTDDDLANATYYSEFTPAEGVTLVDGEYVSEDLEVDSGADPDADVALERLRVVLTDFIARGDLDGDGTEDAAVILNATTGGSGVFSVLAAVLNRDGEPNNVDVALLGDRVEMQEILITDGTITLDLITHGPEDPLCCPTQPATLTYALQENELVEQEEASGTMVMPLRTVQAEPAAPTFSPDAPANAATVELGGTDDIWLDPTLISVLSGILEDGGVEATGLGEGCAGFIPARPDVVLNWREDATVETLRIFLLSTGDPTLTIVTPDGTILCNDDLNPLVLDPYIEIPAPAAGRYAIFVGSFEEQVHVPSFVVFTSQELTPATLDLALLFPRDVDPDAVGEPLPRSALQTDGEPTADPKVVDLQAGFGTYSQEMSGGGSLGVFNIELENQRCTGFVDALPTFAFTWAGDAEDAERLRLFYEGDNDSTLVVETPDGSFACSDDFDGARNLNPALDIVPSPGRYTVYVGSFSPSMEVSGTLTIAESTELEPAPLTAEMLTPAEEESQ